MLFNITPTYIGYYVVFSIHNNQSDDKLKADLSAYDCSVENTYTKSVAKNK
jgi:hypothetical protein